jgi:hypothetical protein
VCRFVFVYVFTECLQLALAGDGKRRRKVARGMWDHFSAAQCQLGAGLKKAFRINALCRFNKVKQGSQTWLFEQ